MNRHTLLVLLVVGILMAAGGFGARWLVGAMADDAVIVLHGASQFDDRHSYTKALEHFAERVAAHYDGPERLEFILHKNGELGVEKDYMGYMNLGVVVDYAIVSPSHISTFSRMATVMDIPFTFRDVAHYTKAMEANVFRRVEDDLRERADVLVLGYGGGEKRHFFGRRPVRTMDELRGFAMRVQGAPIQTRMFSALGASPTVISSAEVYNALQTGVIDGAENSASAIEQSKWYEVGSEVSLSTVSIIVRPLIFSGKTFRRLPEALQQAIVQAGVEAALFERNIEMTQDDALMRQLSEDGKITLHTFSERATMLELADSVKAAFARETGASDVLAAINAIR